MAALDNQAVLESFAEIADAGALLFAKNCGSPDASFRDLRLYRANTGPDLAASVLDLALELSSGLRSVTCRMLAMAGDNCDGWQGLMRIKGVTAVVLVVARVWMKDDSSDLAPTMKELDRRLQQAEEWAVSLRLLQQSHE